MSAAEWIGLASIIVSLMVAVGGAFCALVTSLIAWGVKSHMKSMNDKITRHDSEINKLCTTLEDHGKLLVSCVEKIKNLFEKSKDYRQ